MKDDNKEGTVVLTDKDIQQATSCNVEILRTGKNLIACALFDFDFLKTTISSQKAKDPKANFKKSLKLIRDKIDNKNKEAFQKLENNDTKKEFLEMLFPNYSKKLTQPMKVLPSENDETD